MKERKEIVIRALIQCALSLRSQLENHIRNGNEDAKRAIQPHTKWLQHFEITSFMLTEERESIEKEAGSWDDSLIMENFWKIESFKGLMWVLNKYDSMPCYYDVGNVNDVYQLGGYPDNPNDFINSGEIKDVADIENERHLYEFLQWRCRTELLRLQGMVPPAGDSFEATVTRAVSSIPTGSTIVNNDGIDITINGTRFVDYSDKGTVMSTCMERRLALEWVLGDDSWDETNTDT